MARFCSQCGAQTAEDARFCEGCGAQLSEAAPAVPVAPAPVDPTHVTPAPAESAPAPAMPAPAPAPAKRAPWVIAVAVVLVLALLGGGAWGVSAYSADRKAKAAAAKAESDRKAKLEVAAKFMQAAIEQDLSGIVDLMYDPSGLLKLADLPKSEPNPDAPKLEWKTVDDTLVADVDGSKGVLKLKSPGSNVVVLSSDGESVIEITMHEDGDAWKIDIGASAESFKTAGLDLSADAAQAKACYANQRTIEGAANSYAAETGENVESVLDLVNGGYLKTSPKCPSPGGSDPYTLTTEDDIRVVEPCPVHGYYADSQ